MESRKRLKFGVHDTHKVHNLILFGGQYVKGQGHTASKSSDTKCTADQWLRYLQTCWKYWHNLLLCAKISISLKCYKRGEQTIRVEGHTILESALRARYPIYMIFNHNSIILSNDAVAN